MDLNTLAKARVVALDAVVRPWVQRAAWRAGVYEFLLFGLKQAWACLFGAALVALLLATHFLWPDDAALARYDVLVLAALALQAFLIATRLERWEEARVIFVFHVVGTVMEIFKTAQGSSTYPEESLLRIGGVPLFSGFMYAAVGSYFARASRLFDLRVTGWPPAWQAWALAVLAYGNFYAHHYTADLRWGLFALSALIFARAEFVFTPDRRPRRMPVLLGFLLVAVFIWIAENAGTFAGAWLYPDQHRGWCPVGVAKLGSWYLLMMLSFVLVGLVHRPTATASPAAHGAGGCSRVSRATGSWRMSP